MQPSSNNCYDTGLREECGVFGIYDLDGADVSPSIYYGLSALQHRGQESCGIAVSDTSGPKGHVKSYKGLGLVNEVFKESKLEELSGNIGIGHVRYSTTGSTTVENAQPLVLNYLKGSLSLSHNGNLVNAMELREQMENTGAIFHTSIDSEIIAYGIARERVHSKTVEEYQDHQKNQADHNISLKDPSGVQGVPVLWHHEQIQRNEDQRQDPEDIPGLCEIFIVHHSPCCMGSRIPCSCKKEQADPIIEKSCACSEPQFIFRKVKPCSENGVECPGQTVDAGEHRAHSQENTAGFPDGDPKSPVVDSHNCRQQKNQHRQGGNLQSIT